MRTIEMTYDVVTEESAEHRDFAELGYTDGTWHSPMCTWEEGEVATWKQAYKDSGQPIWTEDEVDDDEDVVEEAARFITQYGAVEGDEDGWYTVLDVDFGEERFSFHPKGFTKAERRELHDLVT